MVGLAFATYIIVDHLAPKETIVKEYDFHIVDRGVGFNLDKDKIHFGIIMGGGTGTRKFTIENNASYTKKIKFLVAVIENESNSNKWIFFDPPSGWIIESKESVDFNLVLKPPKDAEEGRYGGFIIVQIYKTWPWDKNPILPLSGKAKSCFSKDFIEIIKCSKLVFI